MIDKNNKFFTDLDKELPSSQYGERFKEELAQHLEDEVEFTMQKGIDKATAQDQALQQLGDIQTLREAYTKTLRPDLLLSGYLTSLMTGGMAAIFCIAYFFIFISAFFFEDPNLRDWAGWIIVTIIPFFIFLIFYITALPSLLKKTIAALWSRFAIIVATIPLVTLLSVVLLGENKKYSQLSIFIPILVVLGVNYTASTFAAYILTRGFKKSVPIYTKFARSANHLLTILLMLYLIISSLVIHLHPNINSQVSFLRPRLLADFYISTGLTIGIESRNGIYEMWVYGTIFIIMAASYLVRLAVYAYSRKNNTTVNFPGLTLILFTYIISLFITPPAWKIPAMQIGWQRPAANIIEVIEKKQTGPFYYWFLKSFSYTSALSYGLAKIDNKLAFYTSEEIPDYIHTIDAIKSVHEFNTNIKTLTERDILKIRTDQHSYILPAGFTCTSPSFLEPSIATSNASTICTDLTYNSIPIFSGQTPYSIYTILVSDQGKWALIQLGAYSQSGIYLVSLP